MFSIGTETYTVYQTGAMLASTPGTSGTATVGTNNYTMMTLAIAGTPIYWYPALPVMGIAQYETAPVNDEPTVAFDTEFSYTFDETTGGWAQLAGGADTWTGTNHDFFWSCNYRGANPEEIFLWTTNYTAADGIRYWDGATWTQPALQTAAGANTIVSSRIIVSFKNRLIFLNTKETVGGVAKTYVNRCRYSGTDSPIGANAWRVDVPGNGGFVDPSTSEAIITAQFLKDRLIVYFERSTWELVYTGNQIFPFVWQKINTELGAESTFSQVPFDKVVLGVGNVGIHACNGMNVDRIDAKIPQLVFDIHNEDEGVDRVAGVRDFDTEMVYWSYPGPNRSADYPFPNKILTYNYINNSWGINDDSFTAFGYYQVGEGTPGVSWGATTTTWEETGELWSGAGSGSSNIKSKAVIAGNQQGWVVILRPDIYRNSASLQVTNAVTNTFTVYEHNLSTNDYVLVEDIDGNADILRVLSVVDKNTITLNAGVSSYAGGTTLARVSKINIKTKQYNFYTDKDRNMYIPRVDFLVNRTDAGSISIDYFVSSSPQSTVSGGATSGALLGTSVLETSPYTLMPLESTQTRLWHPLYLQAEGECIQLNIYMSPEQLADTDIALADFELHAMIFNAMSTASRLQ